MIIAALREELTAAYMTRILPIKKDGSQSAISDFKAQENTVTALSDFVPTGACSFAHLAETIS